MVGESRGRVILINGWALVARSGALRSQAQSLSDASLGQGTSVSGLAAVITGEVLFSKLFRNFALKLLAVSIGAVIYYIVIQAVLALGMNPNYLKLLSAPVVALFLTIPYWKGRYFSKAVRPARKEAKTDA